MKIYKRSFTTQSSDETQVLGQELATGLSTGATILLSGDLGSGKTVFVQGMAKAMAVPPDCYVTSPTYTLINEYPARLPFFHIDLFRLEPGSDLEEIGLLDLFSPLNVVVVEWPERLHESELPGEKCEIRLSTKSEFVRTIHIIAYGLKMIDLVKGMSFTGGNSL
jgi:tRNA threonylcarbamoyladenosine biosynthesis protein TsaE